MSQLGYDPNAAITMLGKLGSGGGGGLDKYLSTHPAPEDRQQRVRSLIYQENLNDVARRSGGPRLTANLPSSAYTGTNTYGNQNYNDTYNNGTYNNGTYNNGTYGDDGYDYRYDTAQTRGTINATVTQDEGVNRFQVRTDDNRVLAVRYTGSQSRRAYVGDRLRLSGYLNNRNVFITDNFSVLSSSTNGTYNNGTYNNGTYNNGGYDNSGNYNNGADRPRTTLRATVTRETAENRFEVRGDDNVLYNVRNRETTTRNLQVGDRVELTGTLGSRNRFTADTVRVLSKNGAVVGNAQRGGIYGTTNGQRVDFFATVQSQSGDILTVRGDNGETYRVRRNNASTFKTGERIQVTGIYNNRLVQAASIVRL
jgi:hypothetical protein